MSHFWPLIEITYGVTAEYGSGLPYRIGRVLPLTDAQHAHDHRLRKGVAAIDRRAVREQATATNAGAAEIRKNFEHSGLRPRDILERELAQVASAGAARERSST